MIPYVGWNCVHTRSLIVEWLALKRVQRELSRRCWPAGRQALQEKDSHTEITYAQDKLVIDIHTSHN